MHPASASSNPRNAKRNDHGGGSVDRDRSQPRRGGAGGGGSRLRALTGTHDVPHEAAGLTNDMIACVIQATRPARTDAQQVVQSACFRARHPHLPTLVDCTTPDRGQERKSRPLSRACSISAHVRRARTGLCGQPSVQDTLLRLLAAKGPAEPLPSDPVVVPLIHISGPAQHSRCRRGRAPAAFSQSGERSSTTGASLRLSLVSVELGRS